MNPEFNYLEIVKQLEQNSSVFENLLKDISDPMKVWKQAPEKWCLLEIVCHLYDEEREDFRARTKHTLETPIEALPSIDPQGWVLSRQYMNQNYDLKLNQFLHERKESVIWLRSLQNPNWQNAHEHPKFGKLSAKLFLTNWLAHDHLHLKQILKLKFDYLKNSTSENLNYAGNW